MSEMVLLGDVCVRDGSVVDVCVRDGSVGECVCA